MSGFDDGSRSVDSLSAALERLDDALAANVDRAIEARRRLERLRRGLERGESVRELLDSEGTPRTVELLTANHLALETIGADYRAELARALRREGLTIDAIAALFGVTRQRISALLRQPRGHQAVDGRVDLGAEPGAGMHESS